MKHLIKQIDKDGNCEGLFVSDSIKDFALGLLMRYPFVNADTKAKSRMTFRCYRDGAQLHSGIAEKRFVAYEEGTALYGIYLKGLQDEHAS